MYNELQLSVEFGVTLLQDILFAGYDFLNKESLRRDFRKANKKYIERMIDRYGEVKVLGQDKPVPLFSLYVRSNILGRIESRSGGRVQDMESSFDRKQGTLDQEIETVDGEEIVNRLNKFILLGKPGAGKTTFLRYLALAMLSKQSIIKTRRLPIFVTLRDWANKEIDLIKFLSEQFKICGFEQPDLFVEDILKKGKCILLFDGLDEVNSETKLDQIIDQIRDFTDKYSDNQFVISCRIAAYNYWFERFADTEIANFNNYQIERFVKNWFSNKPQIGKECLRRIKERIQLRELASVPLLLSLLCIIYAEDNRFPINRANLYKETVDVLLHRWDRSHRIRRKRKYKQLSIKQREDLLSKIAYDTFVENRFFFREAELKIMIENFITKLSVFKKGEAAIDSLDVLRAIETDHGIFMERARNIHSFSHLTFQEYFTAKYIVDNTIKNTLKDLVEIHLYDERWTDVIPLVAAMLPRADEFLSSIFEKNRLLVGKKEIEKLLGELENILLPHSNSHTKIVRKSVALYFILALEGDRVLVTAFEFLRALDLAYNLKLDYIYSFTAITNVYESNRNLANAYVHSLNRDLSFDLNLIKINSIELIPELSLFLKGNLLIMDCLNADCFISNSTSENFFNKMLEPLSEV